MKKIFFLAAAVVLLPLSANAKKAPDWINGVSKKYPEPRYFIGVGVVSGDKGGEKQRTAWAADHARAEIAKILRIEIDSTTVSQRTVSSEGKSRPKSQSTQTDVIAASTKEILDGVEIKEYYHDKKGKMLYALAVLDRPMAADRLEQQVSTLKEDLSAEMDVAKEYQDKNEVLLSIRHYNRALELANDVNDKNEILSVLNPVFEPQTSFAPDIKRILSGLKKLVRFEVKIEGPAASVRSYVIQGLASGGFITRIGGTGATYLLTGNTDVNYKGEMDMGPELTVQVYQADLDLEIQNPQTNESIGALTWSVSANEKVAALAEKSAIRALGRHVQKTIADKILSSL